MGFIKEQFEKEKKAVKKIWSLLLIILIAGLILYGVGALFTILWPIGIMLLLVSVYIIYRKARK